MTISVFRRVGILCLVMAIVADPAPSLNRFRGIFYAVFAWIVMHAAIMIASNNHPNYYDPVAIIGGVMSHFLITVPLALVVKRQMA